MAGLGTLWGEMLGRSSNGTPSLLFTVILDGVKPSLALKPVEILLVCIGGIWFSNSEYGSAWNTPE